MKKIKIEVPDGYELVKTGDGWKLEEVDRSIELRNDRGDTDVICIDPNGNSVAFIGIALAPEGLENRCIILHGLFNWEITTHKGHHVCIPTKKS